MARILPMVALLAAVLVGCHHRIADDTLGYRPVWPPAPDPPRIEYVQAFHEPRDLGIGGNKFVRFLSRLVRGRVERGMTRPYAVTVMSDGQIAVADPDGRSVHLFDERRSRYRRIAGTRKHPLISPVGVAADGENRLYVADSGRALVEIFDGKGRWLGSLGEEDRFLRPTGLAYDRQRRMLYVVDTLAHRVHGFDATGRRTLRIGERGTGEGEFNYPVAVAVDDGGRLYVSDSMNFRVQVFDASGSFIRAFGGPGRSPGDLDKSKGIALDGDGHVYLVDTLHDVVQVFDGDGRLLTVLGATGDRAGEFWLPAGIFIDEDNRILIADSANHRVQVLRYLGDPGAQERRP